MDHPRNILQARPRKASREILKSAAETFATSDNIESLVDREIAYDEAREVFVKTMSSAWDLDPWKLASDLADEWGDTVSEIYVDVCEGFLRHLDATHRRQVGEWVAAGVPDPVPTLARAKVRWGGKPWDGLAFHCAANAEQGACSFVADERRASAVDASGALVSSFVVNWEDVLDVAEPDESDLVFHARFTAAEEVRRKEFSLSNARFAARMKTAKAIEDAPSACASMERDALIASCGVSTLQEAAWLAGLLSAFMTTEHLRLDGQTD